MQSVGAAGGSPIHTARRHFRSCWDGVHGDLHTQLAQDLEHVRLLLAKSIGQVRDVLDGDDGVQLAQDGCGEDELGLVLVMCPVHSCWPGVRLRIGLWHGASAVERNKKLCVGAVDVAVGRGDDSGGRPARDYGQQLVVGGGQFVATARPALHLGCVSVSRIG